MSVKTRTSITKEEVLLVCNMSEEEDRSIAEALEKLHHIDLSISCVPVCEYGRYGGQPTLFRKLVSLQGKEIRDFIKNAEKSNS